MFHRFLLCSGLAAAVNILTGFVLYAGLGLVAGWEYALSVALAFLSGMAISFLLNRRFTFAPSGRQPMQELRDFFLVSMGGLILTTSLAWVFRQALAEAAVMLSVPPPLRAETLAHGAAVGVTAIYSFLAHKFVSFRAARAAANHQRV